jgi:hypothetical protein
VEGKILYKWKEEWEEEKKWMQMRNRKERTGWDGCVVVFF